MAVHACVQTGLDIIGKHVGGHRNDGDAVFLRLALPFADGPRGVQAVHFGHHHIHQHGIKGARRGVFHSLHRLAAVDHRRDFRPLLLQQRNGDLAVQLVILGQQQMQTMQIFGAFTLFGHRLVVPWPGSLSTSSEPCIWSTSFLVMAMPSPVPL